MQGAQGTVKASDTFRPSALGWENFRWWASAGCRPQTRQGCVATNLRWSLSRRRFTSGMARRLLSMGRLSAIQHQRVSAVGDALSAGDGRSQLLRLTSRAI